MKIFLFNLVYKCTLQILIFEFDVSKHMLRDDPYWIGYFTNELETIYDIYLMHISALMLNAYGTQISHRGNFCIVNSLSVLENTPTPICRVANCSLDCVSFLPVKE